MVQAYSAVAAVMSNGYRAFIFHTCLPRTVALFLLLTDFKASV